MRRLWLILCSNPFTRCQTTSCVHVVPEINVNYLGIFKIHVPTSNFQPVGPEALR